MLVNLHVRNLALIDEADVFFRKGMNILTGETGAGKSIIIGSMNLALGAKAPKDFVRREDEDAFVELTFAPDNAMQTEALAALGVDTSDDEVVLTRRISGGRSVARINGMSANAAQLKEAASVLLDMHGQHEHQSLLYRKKHLEILDAYGRERIAGQKAQTKAAYEALKSAQQTLDAFAADDKARRREASFLAYEINELEEAQLREGEDDELEARYRLLSASKQIIESLKEAHQMTGYDSNGAGELLGRACKALSGVQSYGAGLASLYEQAVELDSLLNDFNRELSDYEDSMQFGDEEFYETEKRLDTLNHIKSKYGATITAALDGLEKRRLRLADLEHYEERLLAMQKELAKCRARYQKEAGILSALRKEAAVQLCEQIKEELVDLNFLDVRFEMRFALLAHETANGMDEAEFMISTNPGEELRPLGAVASGGELSRIMLAIKVVLADKDDTGTLVFDEIDAGISGRTAQKVSEKMKKISRSHQVICITHLPQIAAMADAHFSIAKSVQGGATISEIRLLNEEEEIDELSRMLGGAKITDAVRQNATEMKLLAKSE